MISQRVNYKQNVNSLDLVCYYGLFLYPTIESIIDHPIADNFTRIMLILLIWKHNSDVMRFMVNFNGI